MSQVAPALLSGLLPTDERSERIARQFQVPVFIAALLALPVLVIEESAASDAWQTLAAALNWLVWSVFVAELVTMLAVVPNRSAWLRRHPLEVAIVVLTPPFLPASLQALRAFRLLRLLPLVRVARLSHRIFSIDGVRYASLLALVTALGGGAAFSAAEGNEVSTWDGLWWSVTTMTTVGYGDIIPHTTLGRIVAMVVMLVGIAFIAILTAALAERLVRRRVTEETAAVALDVDEAEATVLLEIGEIAERLRILEARLSTRARRAP